MEISSLLHILFKRFELFGGDGGTKIIYNRWFILYKTISSFAGVVYFYFILFSAFALSEFEYLGYKK